MRIYTENQARLAKGFQASGVWAGIKKSRKDIALLLSEKPAAVAGVFTKNVVQGAPVVICREHLAHGQGRAIVINSGNANTCTGSQGLTDSRQMAALVARAIGAEPLEVFPVSTGVIGIPLPMDKITSGITEALAELKVEGLADAAQAILTTDLRPKTISVSFGPNDEYTLTGVAKGSGMIHPNMATMLAFLLTDAAVTTPVLQSLLGQVTDDTFNMISVDGDTSTNDSVLALANGAAGGEEISPGSALYAELAEAFTQVCTYLAKEIARDGEGATKLINIRVSGAVTKEQARIIARSVAASNLVKTAVYGADANWGRILCAAGYSGATFEPELVRVEIAGIEVFRDGQPILFNEAEATRRLKLPEVELVLDLGQGDQEATAYSCDFTYDYVKINASYRS